MKKYDIFYRWFWIFISSVFIFLIANIVFAAYVKYYEVRLTNNWAISRSGPFNGRTVATDSLNRVHTVWADYRRGMYEVYYKRSIDGGTTWESSDRRLTNHHLNHALGASIASSPEGYLHIVWQDKRSGAWKLYYIRSLNGGATFQKEKQLDPYPIGHGGPCVCYGGNGIVNIVYRKLVNGRWELFNIYSSNNGDSSSSPQRLTNANSIKDNPSCAIDGNGYVYLVWNDTRDNPAPEKREVYFKRSLDGGRTWEPDMRLTEDPANGSADSSIAVDVNGHVHVVWHDDRSGSWEIYYKESPDRGVTWGPDIQLTSRPNPDYDPETVETDLPSIAVDNNGNVHIFWQDKDIGSIKDNRLFYKGRYGTEWTPTMQITNTMSVYASATVDANNTIHLVWTDGRYEPNYEIFYKKGIFTED